MKPSFAEYNSIASDACQILAIAEIQYGDLSGAVCNELRAQQCRTLRLSLGAAILDVGHQLQNKSVGGSQMEESAIAKLKPALNEIYKKISDITSEMRQAVASKKSKSFLAEVLFSEKSDFSVYNLQRLQTNLSLLLHQEKEVSDRSYSYNGIRLATNIFMQPLNAVECETKANQKLSDFIAARVEQTVRIESQSHAALAEAPATVKKA